MNKLIHNCNTFINVNKRCKGKCNTTVTASVSLHFNPLTGRVGGYARVTKRQAGTSMASSPERQ